MNIENVAFIDGQNLHLGTKTSGWSINHSKFRVYLREKYNITEAYYFLGYVSEEYKDLYDSLQRAGFILNFKEHSPESTGNKKGNVDCDIIFDIMKKLIENEPFNNVFIVSGDGDYKKLVDYLLRKGKFGKILFPNKKFASSLYKKLGTEHFDHLEENDVREKISYMKKAP